MKFSVVIPCFNQGTFLQECLASVRAQTLPAHEIIVVDDGSTDPHSIERIDALCTDGVILVRQANGGLSAARNAGIRRSSGDFIVPLDADDQLTPDALAAYAGAIVTEPDVDLWYPDIEFFGLTDGYHQAAAFDRWRLLWENYLVSSTAIRRAIFDVGIRYNERIRDGYEDWEFYIHACCERNYLARRLPRAIFRYRQWGYSMVSATNERGAQIFAQIRRERPVYTDAARLVALKRESSPFLAVPGASRDLQVALARQSFQDFSVGETPGAWQLTSHDDTALAEAFAEDGLLLEKIARALGAHEPGLVVLATVDDREEAWPGALLPGPSHAARCLGLVSHAGGAPGPVLTLVMGENRGGGVPVPAATIGRHRVAEVVKERARTLARGASLVARGLVGDRRHERFWARVWDLRTLLGLTDLRRVPRREAVAAAFPGPTRTQPSIVIAVDRVDAQANTLLAELARETPWTKRWLFIDDEKAGPSRRARPLVDGWFSLPATGKDVSALIGRVGADALLIAGSRRTADDLTAIRRRSPNLRVAVLLDRYDDLCASRYNRLVDAYAVVEPAIGEALVTRAYVSPGKIHLLGSGSRLSLVELLLPGYNHRAARRTEVG